MFMKDPSFSYMGSDQMNHHARRRAYGFLLAQHNTDTAQSTTGFIRLIINLIVFGQINKIITDYLEWTMICVAHHLSSHTSLAFEGLVGGQMATTLPDVCHAPVTRCGSAALTVPMLNIYQSGKESNVFMAVVAQISHYHHAQRNKLNRKICCCNFQGTLWIRKKLSGCGGCADLMEDVSDVDWKKRSSWSFYGTSSVWVHFDRNLFGQMLIAWLLLLL